MIEIITPFILLLSMCFILIFISPFIAFAEGWIVGWLIKIIFGTVFISGLKLIGINITVNAIPLLCGTLNLIGSFFRPGTDITSLKTKIKNKNNEIDPTL